MSLEYSQSTGRLVLRRGGGTVATVAIGYSGRADGLNAPEMEHKVGIGPIPQGTYYLRERHHQRFKAPALRCEPTEATAKFLRHLGRSGFWIHGDNGSGKRDSSSGCIILNKEARLKVCHLMAQGHPILVVVP